MKVEPYVIECGYYHSLGYIFVIYKQKDGSFRIEFFGNVPDFGDDDDNIAIFKLGKPDQVLKSVTSLNGGELLPIWINKCLPGGNDYDSKGMFKRHVAYDSINRDMEGLARD